MIIWIDSHDFAKHLSSIDPFCYQPISEFFSLVVTYPFINRVPGLGFLPGLCCPHHDRIQSNGVPRAEDFEAMMRRHGQEVGIAIDHWAALVIDGEDYRILAISDKPGSQLPTAADGAKPPPPLCHQGQDSYADARPGVTKHSKHARLLTDACQASP